MKKVFFLVTLLVVCLTFSSAILAEDQQPNSASTNIAKQKVLPSPFFCGKWDCLWQFGGRRFWATFDIVQAEDPSILKIIYDFRGRVYKVDGKICNNDGNCIQIDLPKNCAIVLTLKNDEVEANYSAPDLPPYSAKLTHKK